MDLPKRCNESSGRIANDAGRLGREVSAEELKSLFFAGVFERHGAYALKHFPPAIRMGLLTVMPQLPTHQQLRWPSQVMPDCSIGSCIAIRDLGAFVSDYRERQWSVRGSQCHCRHLQPYA